MDSVIFEDVANSLSKLKMYPYFDICHYILMSIAVKEDTPQSGSVNFSRRHPFSCWFATMLMCFGGVILSNFICGSPLFLCFDDTVSVLTATAVWYLINYFPFDLLYRLCKFLPIRLTICALKEIQRAKKISLGVHHGLHLYPESAVMCVLLGLLKGAGYCEMKLLQRLARGVWLPASNEFIHPTFTTKISLVAAIAYYCHHLELVPLQDNELFLVVAGVLVYLRVTMILLGLKDPFVPFENIISTIVFGGTVDALRNAFELSRSKVTEAAPTSTSPVSGMTGSLPTQASNISSTTATTTNMNASSGQPSNPPHSPTGGTFMCGPGQTAVRDNISRQSSTPADKKRD